MKLLVNIDQGFAINEQAIAVLLRDKNTDHTKIILVSGNSCVVDTPLSKLVGTIDDGYQPQESDESPSDSGPDSGVGIQV